mmetsp:Transcript_30356/g.51735  ORF Transcript_30356/g.51735 Transcript_30356/m.51735 type:complete len:82 (+) Transcript_30356:1143-1388(+)
MAEPMPLPPSLRAGYNENKYLHYCIVLKDDSRPLAHYHSPRWQRVGLLHQTWYESARKPKITDANVKRGVFRLVFGSIVIV